MDDIFLNEIDRDIDSAAAGAGGGHGDVGGHGDGGAPAGFRRPRDHELIEHYLRPKIAGRQPLPPAAFAVLIHDADIRSAPPIELTAAHAPTPGPAGARRVWYFFSPVLSYNTGYRVGRGGMWVPCNMMIMVEAAGGGGSGGGDAPAAVGYWRRLTYRDPAAPREREWEMIEYGIPGKERRHLVLCEVFRRRPASQRRPPPLNHLTSGVRKLSL